MIPQSELTKFAKSVKRKYPDINRGGCGVFAALIAKRLQQFYPVQIVVFGEEGDSSIDVIRSKVSTNLPKVWQSAGINFNHLVIEFIDDNGDKWHYDATGIHAPDGSIWEDRQIPGYVTVDEVIELASVQEGWNYTFNRKMIPELDNIVQDFFGNYGLLKTELSLSRWHKWWDTILLPLYNINIFLIKWV